MDDEEQQLDALLNATRERLVRARGNAAEVRSVIRDYLVGGDEQELSPFELRDYFDISSPGLVEEAGYTIEEQAEAATLFDEVSSERYGGPSD